MSKASVRGVGNLGESWTSRPLVRRNRIVSGSSVDRKRPCSAVAATRHPLAVVALDEDAVELRALLLAAVDAQRQVLAELVELADLDRRAERARLEVEAQAFVAIMGVGLEIADDERG